MKRIDIINGVNINMIGHREKDIYGYTSIEKINNKCVKLGKDINIDIYIYHNNVEGEIVNYIHKLYNNSNFIIINPGAYTHYSIAIRDALLSVNIPFIEVHFTNIFSREEFRRKSVLSDIAVGLISGFGEDSYYLAIKAAEKNI